MSSDYGTIPYEIDLFSEMPSAGEIVEYVHEEFLFPEGTYYHDPKTIYKNPAGMIVLLGVVVGVLLIGILGRLEHSSSPKEDVAETAVSPQINSQESNKRSYSVDSITFVAPYKDYSITQGIHGLSYGHMAIDIAAGRGEPILSPINGVVTQLYVDEYGNPTIVIENDVYQVMFLHGDYSVAIGDSIKIGQTFGNESNKGYTMDMAGNLCYNREWCGNHSHLNVYDKRIHANINPLDLIGG